MAQIVITVQSTKGGVGKTTTVFNLAGLLADLGYKVLAIDVDVQASLSKAVGLSDEQRQKEGLVELLARGELTEAMISETRFQNFDIVLSNHFSDVHENALAARGDRLFRIKAALRSPIASTYDVIIMDSKGAIGALQDAATTASDFILTPISPDILSANEYLNGSQRLIENLQSAVNMGITTMPKIFAFLNRMERTKNAINVAQEVIGQSRQLLGVVNVMQASIPFAKAYTEAMTQCMPVHTHEFTHAGKSNSAYLSMHLLVWEIFPSLKGVFATNWGRFSAEDIETAYGNHTSDYETDITDTECAE